MMTEEQMVPFWYWINERDRIYWRKGDGQANNFPWTQDPILQTYRFCNVYRELDRVTIAFKEQIRRPYEDNPNLWFMYTIARQFNWPPTIQALIDEGLWPTKTWDGKKAGKYLDKLSKQGMQQYNGAYMTTGSGVPEGWSKARFMCEILFEKVWQERKEMSAICQTSIEYCTKAFTQFNGFGLFLGYEVATDLRHCEGWLDKAPDIFTWANTGPGAKRGLNRLHGRPLEQSIKEQQALEEMRYLLSMAPLYLDKGFIGNVDKSKPLFEMRDVEHCLCETDKYLRAKTGEGRPKALYKPGQYDFKFGEGAHNAHDIL